MTIKLSQEDIKKALSEYLKKKFYTKEGHPLPKIKKITLHRKSNKVEDVGAISVILYDR